jgi:hypothetical protein
MRSDTRRMTLLEKLYDTSSPRIYLYYASQMLFALELYVFILTRVISDTLKSSDCGRSNSTCCHKGNLLNGTAIESQKLCFTHRELLGWESLYYVSRPKTESYYFVQLARI